jgi:hypothetical protein
MDYVHVTATPDPDRTPRVFDVFARASFVEESRLYDWNLAPGGDAPLATLLFEMDGDLARVRDALSDAEGVRSLDATPAGDGRFAALLVLEPAAIRLMSEVFATVTSAGIVVTTPVVYREGSVDARIVGTAPALQAAVGAFPSDVDVEINAIGEFDRRRDRPVSRLSERQREAVLAALDLGYYETPRQATHEDVAAELGCATNTASEHLQKAEAALLQTVLRNERA